MNPPTTSKGQRTFTAAEHAAIAAELDGKSILVTGGTGSFGQKFIETIVTHYRPRRVVIFSRDELKQVEMREREVFRNNQSLRFFIGDVRDRDRLEMAFRGVDYVIHAAALKQVPTAEYNPFECIRTNVHGAENVVTAAIRCGVRKVVALSTDKATNPINLYGASKLASDKIFVAAKWLVGSGNSPSFSVVRYGNVVGSRGSVVPLFHRLISQGIDSLPITDPRMTRFWITLNQGVDFVLSTLASMRGGEIFVPKIPSLRITDLAKVMAPHLATHVTGIRPGEKLHEQLITADDARLTYELADRYIVRPSLYDDEPDHNPTATPVNEDFQYASNTNPIWMTEEACGAVLAESGYAVRSPSTIVRGARA